MFNSHSVAIWRFLPLLSMQQWTIWNILDIFSWALIKEVSKSLIFRHNLNFTYLSELSLRYFLTIYTLSDDVFVLFPPTFDNGGRTNIFNFYAFYNDISFHKDSSSIYLTFTFCHSYSFVDTKRVRSETAFPFRLGMSLFYRLLDFIA